MFRRSGYRFADKNMRQQGVMLPAKWIPVRDNNMRHS